MMEWRGDCTVNHGFVGMTLARDVDGRLFALAAHYPGSLGGLVQKEQPTFTDTMVLTR